MTIKNRMRKLTVPEVHVKPKLFVLRLSYNDKVYSFKKVAISLDKAIDQCFVWNTSCYNFTLNDYLSHTEVSVDEINSLFKNFRHD